MARAIFTIGHSNRSIEAFIELLRQSRIELVVDVRSLPGSRANPQFNDDALAASLAEVQIGYEHIRALGGLRGKVRESGTSPNGFWDNRSFRNYADYALGEAFEAGLARLRQLAAEQNVAIMCSEAVWWRCHRRIIADYLLAGGDSVLHILGPQKVVPAVLTPAAHMRLEGGLIYPA